MSDVKVRRGDTLYKIAKHHHVSLHALEKANKQVHNPNVIHVGQKLHLPDAFHHAGKKDHAGKTHAKDHAGKTHGDSKQTDSKHAAAKDEKGISGKGLSHRYRRWFGMVKDAAKKFGLKVSTLFGVMSRETNGRNIVGDGGHGRGLMQIDDRTWGSWIRSHHGGLDARSNIMKGAAILKQNINFFKGRVAKSKVLRAALAAYNGGPGRVLSAIRRGRSPDSVTTGGNYSRDVMNRAKHFERQLKR